MSESYSAADHELKLANQQLDKATQEFLDYSLYFAEHIDGEGTVQEIIYEDIPLTQTTINELVTTRGSIQIRDLNPIPTLGNENGFSEQQTNSNGPVVAIPEVETTLNADEQQSDIEFNDGNLDNVPESSLLESLSN